MDRAPSTSRSASAGATRDAGGKVAGFRPLAALVLVSFQKVLLAVRRLSKFLGAAAIVSACAPGPGAAGAQRGAAGATGDGTAGASGTNGGAGGTMAMPANAGASDATAGNAATSGGASGSATGGSGGATAAGGDGHAAPPFILGADVSWLLEDEAAGATYFDRGKKLELLTLLKARGFNYIRIRTFVDPAAADGYASGKPEAWCDLEHTIELARRVRALGMGFLLDFHYSDNFADPGKQMKPSAWQALPFDALVKAVHDYTQQTLQALVAANSTPDMVQIGNEITAGMLFPDGTSSDENWPKLGQLLKAGASATQEVDPTIRIMLHIEKGGDNATTRWWVDHALAEKIPFQILGQSCYTMYQGPPDSWQSNFSDLVTRYPSLSFVIAEYSQEKRAANDIMHALPDRRGLGTFIWEPTRWMEAVFDRDGQRYDGNALLDTYSKLATDYGIAVTEMFP
ncbi:MAG TPA: glycosyl hydrolase 53 family protein [Polyangiaceae bacterium]|nr:glycosyl hydrolase 53 family protein [Polyangiaceae bacterium]